MVLWIALAIPSLIARLFLRKKKEPLGILQDLFVGMQLSFLPLYLTPIFQLLILYDVLINKRLQFRLCGSCVSFLFQLSLQKSMRIGINRLSYKS